MLEYKSIVMNEYGNNRLECKRERKNCSSETRINAIVGKEIEGVRWFVIVLKSAVRKHKHTAGSENALCGNFMSFFLFCFIGQTRLTS
jgi:hypothetical protein